MDILHVNASYKPAYIYGGPTMSVSQLCEELVKEDFKLEVLTTTANGETELNLEAGKKNMVDGVAVTYFRRLTKDPSHFSPALLLGLYKRLNRANNSHSAVSKNRSENMYPIVHIHAWWNMVSVGACLVALLFSGRVLLSPRGTLSNYSFNNRKRFLKNTFHQFIGKALLKRCHFHVSTEKEKIDILSLVNPKSITIIPNFVNLLRGVEEAGDLEIETHTQARHEPVFRLLFLSRVEEKKGLDNLLKALEQIKIPFRLTVAGGGQPDYLSYLKNLESELRLTDKITWLGPLNQQLKFQVLARHDLMVLPSHDESFANVVIESLSVGTPVLLSEKVGLADYVLRNNLGWVYQPGENNLTDCLVDAYHNQSMRLSVRQMAPQKIKTDYDPSRLMGRYIKMYREEL